MNRQTTITIVDREDFDALQIEIEGDVKGKVLFLAGVEIMRMIAKDTIKEGEDVKEIVKEIWEALDEQEKTSSTES